MLINFLIVIHLFGAVAVVRGDADQELHAFLSLFLLLSFYLSVFIYYFYQSEFTLFVYQFLFILFIYQCLFVLFFIFQ